jgi:hypothetical protein
MMVVDSPSVAAALQTPALQESYMVPLTPEGYRDFDSHRPAILASASGVTAAARTYPRGFPTLDRPGIDPNAPPADLSAYLARQEATVQPSDVRGGLVPLPVTYLSVQMQALRDEDLLRTLAQRNQSTALQHNERLLAQAERDQTSGRSTRTSARARDADQNQVSLSGAPAELAAHAADPSLLGMPGLWYLSNASASSGLSLRLPNGSSLLPAKAMLDQGSMRVMASATFCKANGIVVRPTSRSINGADDCSLSLLGEASLTLVLAKGTPAECSMQVTALVPSGDVSRIYDVLIGTNVFDGLGMVLSGPKGRVKYYPRASQGDLTCKHYLPVAKHLPLGCAAGGVWLGVFDVPSGAEVLVPLHHDQAFPVFSAGAWAAALLLLPVLAYVFCVWIARRPPGSRPTEHQPWATIRQGAAQTT